MRTKTVTEVETTARHAMASANEIGREYLLAGGRGYSAQCDAVLWDASFLLRAAADRLDNIRAAALALRKAE